MMKREGRHTSRIAVLALLFSCALSSCRNSLLEGYQPSDDFKDDWENVKSFNRWIDPRVGAFLLMEESYIDLNRFDLEKESVNLEGKVTGRLFRSKTYPDLVVTTGSVWLTTLDYFYFEAPSRYVKRIVWENSDLTLLGCRYSEGPEAFAKACAARFHELPVGPDFESRWAYALCGPNHASIQYHCVPAEYKPNPYWSPHSTSSIVSLFTLSASWGLPDIKKTPTPYFSLIAYEITPFVTPEGGALL